MKKLCNSKPTKRVHPSPTAMAHHHHLSCLPAAVLALAAALSPEEQEVLAYLLGDPAAPRRNHQTGAHHHPDPTCGCFSCYKTFWARWDSSPNRHVIHLVIDAVENQEVAAGTREIRRRRRRGGGKKTAGAEDREEILQAEEGHVAEDGEGSDGGDERKGKGSSVRRLVSFVGERVWPWGFWN